MNSSKPTVLVVEDDTESNRFITETLAHKYNVISALNGQQGLELALKVFPSLIVLDSLISTSSSEEIITEIRKNLNLSGVPILLLAEHADEKLKSQLLERGAQCFIAFLGLF